MRDIRQDLRERLEALEREQETLEQRVAQIVERKRSIGLLIEEEDRQWVHQPPLDLFGVQSAPQSNGRTHTPLGRFILEALSDDDVWTTERLTSMAKERGLLFTSKQPYKAMHFALVGMKKNGYVDMPASRHWRIRRRLAGADDSG